MKNVKLYSVWKEEFERLQKLKNKFKLADKNNKGNGVL